MKFLKSKKISVCILVIAGFLLPVVSVAQCMFHPIAMKQKITASQFAVLGKVSSQHCYMDNKGNIYTLNKIDITAWLKNYRANTNDIYVITEGGVLGNKAQITEPAIQLQHGKEYFLMLQKDNLLNDDKNFRQSKPSKIQAYVYADAQGALLLQDGSYHDITDNSAFSEEVLLQKIYTYSKQVAKRPDGSLFAARKNSSTSTDAVAAITITSISPNPGIAGTIRTSDFLLITGSGFGSVTGTVSFKNADDGGATYIAPLYSTDYIKWTNDSIIVKIPSNAGTGKIRVRGTLSTSVLTISYAHISINSSFSGFTDVTRQRYYLRNKNDSGGYTFKYNTTSGFNAKSVAKSAFSRALNTWTCNTGINWTASGPTAAAFADDNVNVVLFDPSLPDGVLGRATSRFSGGATGSCDQANTVWYLEEVDVQFKDIPVTGYTWNFGAATPSSTQYSFQSVALHELGHAHGLGHSIAPNQVMYYSIANGVKHLVLSAGEIDGGLLKMSYSTVATCFNPTGSGSRMITDTSCTSKQVADIAANYQATQNVSTTKWLLYPNPATNLLYIRSAEGEELRLINASGFAVKQVILQPGLNKIDVSNVSNGVYYIQSNKTNQRTKITVLH
jgi:hypothetical protein